MGTHHYNQVNPLINPVRAKDVIIAASGDRYLVTQGMRGSYALQNIASGEYITGEPVTSQIDICWMIEDMLQNL